MNLRHCLTRTPVPELIALAVILSVLYFIMFSHPAAAATAIVAPPASEGLLQWLMLFIQAVLSLMTPDTVQTLFLSLYAAIAWLIHRTIKSKALKDVFMASLDKAAAYGLRAAEGWVERDKLSQLGNQRLLNALVYAHEMFPRLAKQMGYDKTSLAKMLWARLPEVDGKAPDFAALVAEWELQGHFK